MKRSELKALSLSAMAALLLGACGGAGTPGLPAKASFVPAEGQVSVVTAAPTNLNAYAAARFLDQASWGPTPSSVAEVQSLGIEAWIDKQLALRASVLNAPNYVIDFDDSNKAAQSLAFNWTTKGFYELPVTSADQLRLRTTWGKATRWATSKISFGPLRCTPPWETFWTTTKMWPIAPMKITRES